MAMSLFYPLDQLRLLQQVSSSEVASSSSNPIAMILNIVQKEGFSTLYRGLVPVLISLGVSNFTYFFIHNALKQAVEKRRNGKVVPHSPLELVLVSAIAGMGNVLLTCPLWVANTRIKTRRNKGKESDENPTENLFVEMMNIVREGSGEEEQKEEKESSLRTDKQESLLEEEEEEEEEEGSEEKASSPVRYNWGNLWHGVVPSLLLVSNPIVQFVVYERVKAIVLKAKQSPKAALSSTEAFLIGGLGKLAATLVTYPLQISQSIQRSHRKNNTPVPSIVSILSEKLSKEGISGWFRGLQAKVLQTVLAAAFMFLVYEKIYQLISQGKIKRK
jgi:adenine nucleotide transporter 17